MSLAALKDFDRNNKPFRADEEWLESHSFYEDTSRSLTMAHLQKLGIGIKRDDKPLEISLLRRIIDRIAVVYDRPPTRWLENDRGSRLAETNKLHRNMLRIVDRAQYDLSWRKVDRLRALLRQVIIRFYPSDVRGSVVMRVFEPFNVMRRPSPIAPDQLDADHEFALCLCAASDEADEVWEHWTRNGDTWFMSLTNGRGDMVDDPFGESSGQNPYAELPAMMIYDEESSGRSWLPPRASRVAWCQAINGIANDLRSLVINEAHSTPVITTNDPNQVPDKTGTGTGWVLPGDATAQILSANPKIAESEDVLEKLISLWSISEDLPGTEFSPQKIILTGAALRAQERALTARREAQVALAYQDERVAWRKFGAVHNLHGYDEPIDYAYDMTVELADIDQPTDMRELQESLARSIMLGSKSIIDLIQVENGVSREKAIKIYERVQQDKIDYADKPEGSVIEGPQPAQPEQPQPPLEEARQGSDSVVDAIEENK